MHQKKEASRNWGNFSLQFGVIIDAPRRTARASHSDSLGSLGIRQNFGVASLLWRVARYTSGEAVTSQWILQRQSTVAAPPQSSRLTLRKRRESVSRLKRRETWHRSIGFSGTLSLPSGQRRCRCRWLMQPNGRAGRRFRIARIQPVGLAERPWLERSNAPRESVA